MNEYNDHEIREVEKRLLYIIFPLMLLLFFKMWYGLRWMRLKFARNALSTFYIVSFSFYFAFFFQMVMILMTGWKTFSVNVKVWLFLGLNSAVVNWVFLHMQIKFIDRIHYQKNEKLR